MCVYIEIERWINFEAKVGENHQFRKKSPKLSRRSAFGRDREIIMSSLLPSARNTTTTTGVNKRKCCAIVLIVLFLVKLFAFAFVAMTFGGKHAREFARQFALLPSSSSSTIRTTPTKRYDEDDGNDFEEDVLVYERREDEMFRRETDDLADDGFFDDENNDGKRRRRKKRNEDDEDDEFCNGNAAIAVYASSNEDEDVDESSGRKSSTARKVRLKCSIGSFRAHACFNPKRIKTDEAHVARAFREEKFKGESVFIESGSRYVIEDDGTVEEYASVLVCKKSSGAKCESVDDALPICREETKGKKLTRLALKAATDAARFRFLGKGAKARKFRPVPSEHALMKQMNGERRQETCFFKEVVSEIKRGCDVGETVKNENDEEESDGLNELVRGGYLVGFKGVAMVKKVKPDTDECRSGESSSSSSTSSSAVSNDNSEDDGEDASSFVAEKKLEFLVIEDITRGIQNASIVDVDVSGAPASVCRYCSLDVKNFRLGDGITSGDRFFWKREARCVSSKISDVFENVVLNARSFLGEAADSKIFAALLKTEVENIVELMRKQRFVEFTDSSLLLAYGLCPKTGKPKVRARVIDFGHATWKSIASSQNTLPSNKPWTLSKSVDSSKFTCGAEELMQRLDYIATGKPAPKRCLAACLNYCDASKAEGGYSCRSRAKKDENPIGEEKEKNCPWEFKSDYYS